jgi:hypothetical protein
MRSSLPILALAGLLASCGPDPGPTCEPAHTPAGSLKAPNIGKKITYSEGVAEITIAHASSETASSPGCVAEISATFTELDGTCPFTVEIGTHSGKPLHVQSATLDTTDCVFWEEENQAVYTSAEAHDVTVTIGSSAGDGGSSGCLESPFSLDGTLTLSTAEGEITLDVELDGLGAVGVFATAGDSTLSCPGNTPLKTPEGCELQLGEACQENGQCLSGVCQVSEITPFGICTIPCPKGSGPCQDAGPDGTYDTDDDVFHDNAWCIEYPEEQFKSLTHPDMNRFCLPRCKSGSITECEAIHSEYELCADAEYIGNPLYPGDPIAVCQAPSLMGKTPVDPVTCDGWASENPGLNTQKQLCQQYCDYLKVCQIYEPGHNMDCCEWYCFFQLTPNGLWNEPYKDVLTNYVLWFFANVGNAQQCQGAAQFGDPPFPDANAPAPLGFTCE